MWTKATSSQEPVVCFRATFTLEASLLCVLEVSAGCKDFCRVQTRQLLICSIGPPVYVPRSSNNPSVARVVHLMC
jgi:hypothetical protein